ncbi:MAG: hypothetical protein V1778_02260 [bacterium]
MLSRQDTDMNPNNHRSLIREEFCQTVSHGNLRMRPKAYFAVCRLLWILLAVALVVLVLCLVLFLYDDLQRSGSWYLPLFGAEGWFELLRSLPWIMVAAITIVFFVLLVVLCRSPLAYRRSGIVLFVSLIILLVFFCVVMISTGHHTSFYRSFEGQSKKLSILLSRCSGMNDASNVHIGTVLDRTDGHFTLLTQNQVRWDVILSPGTHFPHEADPDDHDIVLVLGSAQGTSIIARGVFEYGDNDLSRFLPQYCR